MTDGESSQCAWTHAGGAPQPTEAQLRLFDLLGESTVDIVLDLLSGAYEFFGGNILSSPGLVRIVLPVAEQYFSQCAYRLQVRESPTLNGIFDRMCAVELAGPCHPMDLLQTIAILTLRCLGAIDLNRTTGGYEDAMKYVKSSVGSTLATLRDRVAADLVDCTPDHVHPVITPGERVFTFNIETI
jgi:hypothetical protein